MWSKYLRRPMDTLGELCFAQFAKMFRSFSRSKANDSENGDNDAKQFEDHEEEEDKGYASGVDDDNDDKFNYIMTHDNKKRTKLPKYIELSDPFPGEPKMMVKRNQPAVL